MINDCIFTVTLLQILYFIVNIVSGILDAILVAIDGLITIIIILDHIH